MKRGKPLAKKTPLRRRSAKRRGRLKSLGRLDCKPRESAPPTAEERRHISKVRQLGCLVCGRPATIHHVTGYADKMGRAPRSHTRIVPLCPLHHQAVFDPIASDPQSVERLTHRGFYKKYGIDLMAEAEKLWEQSCGRG